MIFAANPQLPPVASADQALPHFPLAPDGQRVEALSGTTFQTIDPFRGHAWATACDAEAGDVDLAVTAARRALPGPWGSLTGFERLGSCAVWEI